MKFSIGGIVPLTCIDFPGCIACVIFSQFCPLRCDYCHNPHLLGATGAKYSIDYLFHFLEKRKNFLEGVVFSGGEPFAQPDIISILQQVKDLGFKVAVHTSGFYTEKFQEALNIVDWVGLDIKAEKGEYEQITHAKESGERAFNSLAILLKSCVDYEVRTTIYPYFFNKEKILSLAKVLQNLNVKNYVLQEYRAIHEKEKPTTLKSIINDRDVNTLSNMFPHFLIRYSNK